MTVSRFSTNGNLAERNAENNGILASAPGTLSPPSPRTFRALEKERLPHRLWSSFCHKKSGNWYERSLASKKTVTSLCSNKGKEFVSNKKNIRYSQEGSWYSLLGTAWKSAKMHLPELSTMVRVVRNQILIYTYERETEWNFSCSITGPNLPCFPEREWHVSLLLHFSETKKPTRRFK